MSKLFSFNYIKLENLKKCGSSPSEYAQNLCKKLQPVHKLIEVNSSDPRFNSKLNQ